MTDHGDGMMHETRTEGPPSIMAKVAKVIEAEGLDQGSGAIFYVWNGLEMSAYTFGDDDPLKVYGALSLLQKLGLVGSIKPWRMK